ncbi:unnamed protein product, partial [Iphiclides podalirius]
MIPHSWLKNLRDESLAAGARNTPRPTKRPRRVNNRRARAKCHPAFMAAPRRMPVRADRVGDHAICRETPASLVHTGALQYRAI